MESAKTNHQLGGNRMQLKTILNRVHKIKGFVYGPIKFSEWNEKIVLEVDVRARNRNRPICSVCGKKGPNYDTRDTRRFELIPLWGIPLYLIYAMRRVKCKRCGVKIEKVPWANGKHELTIAYQWFLAGWAKRMNWTQVADAFQTSWYNVFHSVEMAVEWGRERMNLEGITAIGVDEMQWGSGQSYVTAVYQINEGCKRLLWIGQKRKAKTLLKFFRWFGEERTFKVEFVCSDMWKPYLKVVKKKANQAIHILDRFHIVAHLNKAIDEVRAEESRELKAKGLEPVLKGSRWWFLKNTWNLTTKQVPKLAEVLRYNLRTVRSYLLKEEFQFFWEYKSAWWAGQFLDQWCTKAMRSRIDPMKKVAKMLRRHRELILNWFRAKKEFSSGVVEGLNNKAKVTTRMAYGFRTFRALEMALYHTLGDLPEPKFTHRFF
jgi:transposase